MSNKYTATSQPKGKKTLTIVYKDGVEIDRRIGRSFKIVQIARANRVRATKSRDDGIAYCNRQLAIHTEGNEHDRLLWELERHSRPFPAEFPCFVSGYANTNSFDSIHGSRELVESVQVQFIEAK